MSVFRKHGPLTKAGGIVALTVKELKVVDLRPISKITYKFDPFREGARSFRMLMHYMSFNKVRQTNYKCSFKTEIVSDLSDPEMICKLENGNKIHFQAANLTPLEIFQELNKICLPLLPKTEEVSAAPVPMKITKQSKKRK